MTIIHNHTITETHHCAQHLVLRRTRWVGEQNSVYDSCKSDVPSPTLSNAADVYEWWAHVDTWKHAIHNFCHIFRMCDGRAHMQISVIWPKSQFTVFSDERDEIIHLVGSNLNGLAAMSLTLIVRLSFTQVKTASHADRTHTQQNLWLVEFYGCVEWAAVARHRPMRRRPERDATREPHNKTNLHQISAHVRLIIEPCSFWLQVFLCSVVAFGYVWGGSLSLARAITQLQQR